MNIREDPLVTTEWLAEHIDHPKVRIIDASYKMPGVLPLPYEDYLAAHIKNAVFFSIDLIADSDNSLPHMFPLAEQFARDVSALGISSDDLVIAYDAGTWMAAPRAWWMFKAFGHSQVKVLDGGLKKWRLEGRPTVSGMISPAPGHFEARFNPDVVRSKHEMLRNLEGRNEQVVDARPRARFEGTVEEPWPGRRAGHIPGSRNVPYADLFDPDTGAMKPLDELRAAFRRAGVDLGKPTVTSCGSGVSALVLTLALYRLGAQKLALYDGSWAEWGLPDGPPVATGPA